MDALEAEGFVVLGGPVGDETRALLVIDAESDGGGSARRWAATPGASRIS